MDIINKNTDELLYPRSSAILFLRNLENGIREIRIFYNSLTGEIVNLPGRFKDGEFSYLTILRIDSIKQKNSEFLYYPLPVKDKVFRIKSNKKVYTENFYSLSGDLIIKKSLENANRIYKSYKSEKLPVTYEKLKPGDWNKIKPNILSMEKENFEGTALYDGDEDSYGSIFTNKDIIAFSANLQGKMIGFILGAPRYLIDEEFIKNGKYIYYFDTIEKNSIDITAFEVRTTFQNRGIGKNLLKLFFEEAKKKRYETIFGYLRYSTSFPIIHKYYKPVVEIVIKNFFGEEEDHVFCKIPLR